MKWLVVVVFAGLSPEGDKDLYVFTNPTFETEVQCQADITDPAVVPILVNKVIQDNGYRKIEKVVCMLDNELKELFQKFKKEKGVAL
jgi:hypothetical protein|tara:strand:+ start:1643 stop:1903 length:261 start_codon:yes stop_codon:yes gene_type:complete